MTRRSIAPLLSLLAAVAGPAIADPVPIQVGQSRGVDSRVDYADLVHFGPWDDRNCPQWRD